MAIRLLYFASLKERLGQSQEEMVLPDGVATIAALRAHLACRGGEWEGLVTSTTLRCAVNREMGNAATLIADGDEVAFFPPVTGG